MDRGLSCKPDLIFPKLMDDRLGQVLPSIWKAYEIDMEHLKKHIAALEARVLKAHSVGYLSIDSIDIDEDPPLRPREVEAMELFLATNAGQQPVKDGTGIIEPIGSQAILPMVDIPICDPAATDFPPSASFCDSHRSSWTIFASDDEQVISGPKRAVSPSGGGDHKLLADNDTVLDVPDISGDSADKHVHLMRSSLESRLTNIISSETRRSRFNFFRTSERHEHLSGTRGVVQLIVNNRCFETAVGMLIILNCVCIGVDTHFSLDGEHPHVTDAIEKWDLAFVAFYTIELFLRFIAEGWLAVSNPWVRFDVLLVTNAYLNVVLGNIFKQAAVFRLLRLLRLLRTFRVLQQFQILWTLSYGLLTSANAMMATLFLMMCTLFVFTCVGFEFITKDDALRASADPELNAIIDTYFSSFFRFALSLVQFATVDATSGLYYPLIVAKPALVFYFVPLILVLHISLMNLVTAVLVEGAFENAAANKEQHRAEMAKKIRMLQPMIKQVFNNLDTDGSGSITRREIADFDVNQLPREFQELVDAESMIELFQILDADNSGQIDQEEFVSGVLHLALAEVPVEIMQILKLVRMQMMKQFQKEDRASRTRFYKKKLKRVFDKLCGGGFITRRQAESLDINLLPDGLRAIFEKMSLSLVELFDALDVDGSDQITVEEFVTGIQQHCVAEVPIEIIQILKLVQRQWMFASCNDINITRF